ncbi:hypothetical protein TP2_07785 [Thioclava pacifica DSM 10166]|uniref:Uncharacterized protein n=1 Tax=Thioclava pacifica DSM 10166 TaxID=1353537 RepID=A0A074JTZ4_9RHOB|nr:hypothetical protein TP2_07785 [Thioclava pacifica DSM 10166]
MHGQIRRIDAFSSNQIIRFGASEEFDLSDTVGLLPDPMQTLDHLGRLLKSLIP